MRAMEGTLTRSAWGARSSMAGGETPITWAEEVRRVARHLGRAELIARRAAPSGLDPVRRLVRRLLLCELARYRTRGSFPRNDCARRPIPVFVDADGTLCAVAQLLELSGE